MPTIFEIKSAELKEDVNSYFVVRAKIERLEYCEYLGCVFCRKGKCQCPEDKENFLYLKLALADETGRLENVALFGSEKLEKMGIGWSEAERLVGAVLNIEIGAKIKKMSRRFLPAELHFEIVNCLPITKLPRTTFLVSAAYSKWGLERASIACVYASEAFPVVYRRPPLYGPKIIALTSVGIEFVFDYFCLDWGSALYIIRLIRPDPTAESIWDTTDNMLIESARKETGNMWREAVAFTKDADEYRTSARGALNSAINVKLKAPNAPELAKEWFLKLSDSLWSLYGVYDKVKEENEKIESAWREIDRCVMLDRAEELMGKASRALQEMTKFHLEAGRIHANILDLSNKILIFALFVLRAESCDLSKEEKLQLNSARRAIERAHADVGRLVHESRDFATTAHNARRDARKNMGRNPTDENKVWFERLAEGVRKIHYLADRINDEAHKIGTAKNEMEKCLDRKDLIMCRELANTAKNALEEAKKYRKEIGDSYRNAYTQTDLGIAELADKVRESGGPPTNPNKRLPTGPRRTRPAVVPTLPSGAVPVYDEFDVEQG